MTTVLTSAKASCSGKKSHGKYSRTTSRCSRACSGNPPISCRRSVLLPGIVSPSTAAAAEAEASSSPSIVCRCVRRSSAPPPPPPPPSPPPIGKPLLLLSEPLALLWRWMAPAPREARPLLRPPPPPLPPPPPSSSARRLEAMLADTWSGLGLGLGLRLGLGLGLRLGLELGSRPCWRIPREMS
eukprot:scaffold62675_cov45-Phaeocystis_antarctica.AAC.2